MSSIQDSYLSGSNIDFIEGLYARFLENPASIDPSWREIFEQQGREGRPIFPNGKSTPAAAAAVPKIDDSASAQRMGFQARVGETIYAFRRRRHLVAPVDPLGPLPPGRVHL